MYFMAKSETERNEWIEILQLGGRRQFLFSGMQVSILSSFQLPIIKGMLGLIATTLECMGKCIKGGGVVAMLPIEIFQDAGG